MNRKNKISTGKLLRSIILLLMMGWMGSAWAQDATTSEQLLYSTDFTEWNDIDRKTTIGKTVTQWTEFSNETLTFTLNGVGVDPNGTHSKFPNYTGYMITAKYPGEYSKSEPSVVTSQLKSITKIVLTQAATGGTRGIKVSVKGDGDADWVTIHNVSIVTAKGEVLTLDAENRTNCQIKFENFTLNQNAYIVDLKIYGKATGTSNGIKMLTFEPQEGIIGKYPSKIKCDKDGKAVMPSGNTFSKPGYTFESWTDGTNDYTPGNSYNFTQDVTLKPKMRANTYHLYDNNKADTIVWNLDHSEAPALNIYSEHIQKNLSYTRRATIYIDGNKTETQDVALNINAKSGKTENTDERMNALSGKGALVKNGTQFSLPAMYGMTVTVKASDKVDAENGGLSTLFGTADNQVQIKLKDTANQDSLILKDAVVSTDGKTVTFTYKGDEPTITLTPYVNQGSKADNWFFESITATYPLLANFSYTNTISNPDPTNFPNEKVENACETKVTLEDDTKSGHANTGGRYVTGEKLTITPTPKYGYDYTGIKIGETTYTASPYEYTIQKGENKLEVIYTRKKLHKITLQSSEAELGTVNIEPKYDNFYSEQGKLGDITHIESWYTPETKVTMTAEAATNYIVDYWMDGKDRKDVGETYSFTTNDQDRTIIAHFKEGIMGNVKFVIPDTIRVNGKAEKSNFKNAISIKPDDMLNVRSFTIPTNYTLFKSIDNNGNAVEQYYTLKNWTDGKNKEYKLGNTYSFSTEGETINLVPIFVKNDATQDNRTNNPVIRYDFARKVKEYDDPTAKETRKVCAQTVNIGKNQQVFWTTKVWVEVREAGKDKPHWRDVALWCDTGKKGYIKNGQFDNWCAFGPGTTLWFPSGTGTKISLMSYSKITSTTIDDSVPTLDRERTNSERKKAGLPTLEEEEKGAKSYMYVYTHTTQNPNLRPAIKIGDDYSYYQWLELSTLAANWVVLHTETNDNSRGIINKKDIQPVITGESHERRELEDGDLAFHKGERIKMTFNRKKGYELDKIVDLDKLDENGEPIAVLKMNDNGTVNMVGFDDGTTTTPVDKNEDGSWGTASSTVFVLRKAEAYQSGYTHYLTSDNIRTRYELEFDITTHRRLQICFKEMKNTYYITYNAGDKAEGTSPEATWVEHGDLFVIPTNKTLYYEGNTLHHWVDGAGKEYKIGVAYNAPAEFIRMFPVFKPNEFNILNLTKEATATWHFAKNDGAPTINYEGTKGILVTQLETENPEKAGEKLSIDLKITLDGSNGKFNNVSSVDHPERIQINQGSVVEFPSTKDCVAKWTATVDGKKLTIADRTVILSNKEASVTCSGASSIQKVEFNQGEGAYSKCFSVTYKPQTATKATIESLTCNGITLAADKIREMMNGNDKCVTFTLSPWENDNDTIPAVTGTATENGTVTVTKATVLSPECVATVKSTNYEDITLTVNVNATNKLVPTVTAPTANALTYNGAEQALVTAGKTTGGTMLYRLDDSEWSEQIPTAKNVGKYTVWYKVQGNAEYADVAEQSLTVTVSDRPSGGGASGGGGGGAAPAPTPADADVITVKEDTKDNTTSKPGAETDTTITTKTTVKHTTTETTKNEQGQDVSKTTASVSKDLGDKLLDQAVSNKSNMIEITVKSSDANNNGGTGASAADSVKATEVELPKATVNAIAKDTNADLVIKTDNGEVVLDNKTLETIAGAAKGDTVTIVVGENTQLKETQKPAEKIVGKNGTLFDLAAKIGERLLHQFEGGKAHVTLPMPEKLKGKDVLVIYIDDNGLCKILNHSVEKIGAEDYIRFTTTHFSTFAVVDKEEAEALIKAQNEAHVKELMQNGKFKVTTTKTSKKSVKVTVTAKNNKTLISDIKTMGYTVKYQFYRSTKKTSGYKLLKTKTTSSFTNTKGKKGTKYYYKARVLVYDGKTLIAKSELKQASCGVRTWTK